MARPRVVFFVTMTWMAIGMSSCGGGGSGSNPTAPPSTTPAGTGWVQGQFSPAANFAAMCVTPRSGTDPGTQKPFLDRQGTVLDELNWLRSWTDDLYLWFNEVEDQNPSGYTSDAAYFDVLKTTQTTPSGNPKDKFHFTYATSTWEKLSQSGMEPGYGANFVLISAKPPRQAVVAYTEPGSAAAQAPASLSRGAQLLSIDGVDLINANDAASIATLNAGLRPQSSGESHTFSVLDRGAAAPRTVTLVSAEVTATPVQNVHVVTSPGGSAVGYMLFNDHLATAESALVAAFSQLQSAAVQDLVIDLRYNGGGYLDIASEVAYMIAGPKPTAGQTFELPQFNSKHSSMDPVRGAPIVPVGFLTTTQGFSTVAGQALPTLNLARVFVLTTASTCSASESIINSLQGVNVEVIQVGLTTCGKPYGFYPQDNCGVTYFSIEFQGINAKGFGSYPDGFTPQNTVAKQGVLIPGCSVADDFSHDLGDNAEAMLASALAYRTSGTCPATPAGSVGPSVITAAPSNGRVVKSLWQQNRIGRSDNGR